MAQAIHLPQKCKALSSNPSTIKREKKRKKERKRRWNHTMVKGKKQLF
jgi:hypothetical protein